MTIEMNKTKSIVGDKAESRTPHRRSSKQMSSNRVSLSVIGPKEREQKMEKLELETHLEGLCVGLLGSHHKVPTTENKYRNHFLTALGARSLRSKCQQLWFLPRPLSLAYIWLPFCLQHGQPSVCIII